jgi:hypothetical protein
MISRRRSPWIAALVFALAAGTTTLLSTSKAARCIERFADPREGLGNIVDQVILSSEQLKDVEFVSPEAHTFEGDLRSFAIFAWRDFVALNWPASTETRGKPDSKKCFGEDSRFVVWQTWLGMDEIFPSSAQQQPLREWDKIGLAEVVGNPRKLTEVNQAGFSTKLNDLADPVNRPLVAQNKSYVRYEIRVNKDHYEKVRMEALNLSKNLGELAKASFAFPDQSVSIKAAWLVLNEKQIQQKRFYTTTAKIVDWNGSNPPEQGFQDAVLGLVGIHIVHKTPCRKASVWASFEHVDNVELGQGGVGTPSFHNGNQLLAATSPAALQPLKPEAPLAPAVPVQVVREGPGIHPTIKSVNGEYQNKLTAPWKYYQLVGVQWPTPPAGPGDHFPGAGDGDQRVANTTIETYSQYVSCMDCHGLVKEGTFYLHRRAVPRDEVHEKAIGDSLKDLLTRERNRRNGK